MSTAPFDSTTTLCGMTALRYYRTPPRYLGICPPLPHEPSGSKYPELHAAPLATEVLKLPLHVLTDTQANRSQTAAFRHHVLNCELSFGSKRDTLHGFKVTSPELTLFTLSRMLTFNQLVMVAYEMCGRFTFFKPTPALDAELTGRGLAEIADGWSCVRDAKGKPTSQWMRPPLVTVSELKAFSSQIQGMRGAKLLSRAVDCVSGVCASPFEAQVSMLLWMPPALGGWGYRNFENNYPIRYSGEAQVLTGKTRAEVDLRVLSPNGMREKMIECQGRSIHDREGAGTKDALRATALQSMGYNVTLVTYDQIENIEKFEVLRQMLTDGLGIEWAKKTPRQIAIENKLRSEIFCDWLTFANEPV